MTIGEWFNRFGDGARVQLIKASDGGSRVAYLEPLGGGRFRLVMIDDELPALAPEDWIAPVLNVSDDVMMAVNLWLDAAAHDREEREGILKLWRDQYGL